MNILFLAPSYMSLYKDIKAEMEMKGHTVYWVDDVGDGALDYRFVNSSIIISFLKKCFNRILEPRKKKWEKLLSNELKTQKFDLFFAINGLDTHPYLLQKLKEKNPLLKTSLYIWDTQKYIDFMENAKYFDKVYTFDFDDARKYNVNYLPFYWIDSSEFVDCPILYDISVVGTNHDGRGAIVEDVKRQIDNVGGVNYCFKILDLSGKKKGNDIYIEKPISVKEVSEIICKSNCILDTDRETQYGVTPRLIWALANGKKVLSTNRNLVKMPFYNPNQIKILDRNAPVVDIEFIKEKITYPVSSYFMALRLDKWVTRFL